MQRKLESVKGIHGIITAPIVSSILIELEMFHEISKWENRAIERALRGSPGTRLQSHFCHWLARKPSATPYISVFICRRWSEFVSPPMLFSGQKYRILWEVLWGEYMDNLSAFLPRILHLESPNGESRGGFYLSPSACPSWCCLEAISSQDPNLHWTHALRSSSENHRGPQFCSAKWATNLY